MLSEQVRSLIGGNRMFHLTPDVANEADLMEAGVVDSFGMIALVVALEDRFGIKVTPEEATGEQFRSIASIAAYVEGKQRACVCG